MDADPVVSPADTIRRTLEELRERDIRADEMIQKGDESLDALDALLAVGERDRARIEWLEGEERGWRTGTLAQTKRLGECEEARERDRQQIARLTEALEEIAKGELWTGDVTELAAAVLAGEEDARP